MPDEPLLLRHGLFAVYAGLMLTAAIWDLRRFVIPNWLNAAVLLLFPVAALVLPESVAWWSHLGAALAGLVLAAPLFFRGWMGAGDVKMFAALAAWTGFGEFLALLFYVVLSGGVLALVLLALRGLAPLALRRVAGPERAEPPAALRPGGPVPYGVAIAAGGLLVAVRLPYFAL